MILLLLLFIGLPLSTPAHAQDMQGKTLYEYVREQVRQAEHVIKIELPLERFAAGIYYDNPVQHSPYSPTEDDVDYAVAKQLSTLCGNKELDREFCRSIQTKLEYPVNQNAWIRTLGRDLQMIASGYETGISDYPGHGVNIMSRLPSIARIWKTSNETFLTPVVETSAAGLPFPPENADQIEDKMKELVTKLKELVVEEDEDKRDDSEMVGAVWRYENGVKYVEKKEGSCSSSTANPDTSELMLLKKRWCDIEDHMNEIYDLIVGPYMEDGEFIAQEDFVIFPTWLDEDANLVVWVRADDIGLEWDFPIEPVLPLLYTKAYGNCIEGGATPEDCNDDVSLVRGGTYPDEIPELKVTEGICSHPFSQKGYLCRTYEDRECELDPIEINAEGIVLTRCEPEKFTGPISISPSGPDICEIGGWRTNERAVENNVKDTAEKQSGPDPGGEEIKPTVCSNCAIDFYCSDTCNGSETFAFAEPREDGVVRLCLTDTLAEMGALPYLMIHELIHAQQMCNLDVDSLSTFTNTKEKCCAVEREAYLAQCNVLARDGILEKMGLTIDECASIGSNGSCTAYATGSEGACSPIEMDLEEMWQNVSDIILEEIENGNLPDHPVTCEDAIEKLNPAANAIISSLPLACTPGCIAEYDNTIGNNLCFSGQCLEQSLEWHRLIPGRMALTSADEAYPWDSCPVEDPQYGKFFSPPALTTPHFPKYNPQRLYEELDRALCQINGLPALSPPILCAFNSQRRLNLPVADYIGMTQSLLEQSGEASIPATGLANAASGVGSRRANEFFFRYLERSMKSFSEILQVASTIMEDIAETKFPSAMCPRTAGENVCNDFENQ